MATFTYNDTIPTDLDYCRFRLDDVDPEDYRLSNEAITALLAQFGLYGALLEGCNRIKLFYGKEPDSVRLTAGRGFSWRDRYRAYKELYAELLKEAGGSGDGVPGGSLVDVLPYDNDALDNYLPFAKLPARPYATRR